MQKVKSVASVSFNDNRSISMDIDNVMAVEVGAPMQVDDGQWFCELIVRTTNGVVALQMLSDDPERFTPQTQDTFPEE